VQTHLLARSFLLNVDQHHGEEAARDLSRRVWTGAAGIAAYRIKKAFGLGDGIDAIATVFQLHPHFLPRTYVDFRVERTNEGTVRLSIRDCPALQEADAHSWFGGLSTEPHPAVTAIASVVNPQARCRPTEPGADRFAWEVVIDPTAKPLQEPEEMATARYSRGIEFRLMRRRPLRR